jgi:hypothetical protein
MKLIKNLIIFFIPLVFVSCMDTREELEIKKDGSGTLVLKTDISKMLEMMKSFASADDLQKQGLDKAFDTVMLLKDYVDTAKSVPAEKKALLRDGKVHLVMNVHEGMGKFDMQFPFKSADQLQQLYANLNSSAGGLKSMFEGMGKGKQLPMGGSGDSSTSEQGTDKGMPQIASVYDITVKDGLYSRKVNKERYETFIQTIKLEELKQMSSMLGQMNYTLSVKLSRPIKRVSNSKAVLSDDKKTVTVNTDLMETFEHPELLALEIEY